MFNLKSRESGVALDGHLMYGPSRSGRPAGLSSLSPVSPLGAECQPAIQNQGFDPRGVVV